MSCPVIHQKRRKKLVKYKRKKHQIKIHIYLRKKYHNIKKEKRLKRDKSKIKNYKYMFKTNSFY